MRIFLGAFGQPGHAFPMLALGAELVARGHEVTYETWSRWRDHVEAHGMRFAGQAGAGSTFTLNASSEAWSPPESGAGSTCLP